MSGRLWTSPTQRIQAPLKSYALNIWSALQLLFYAEATVSAVGTEAGVVAVGVKDWSLWVWVKKKVIISLWQCLLLSRGWLFQCALTLVPLCAWKQTKTSGWIVRVLLTHLCLHSRTPTNLLACRACSATWSRTHWAGVCFSGSCSKLNYVVSPNHVHPIILSVLSHRHKNTNKAKGQDGRMEEWIQ